MKAIIEDMDKKVVQSKIVMNLVLGAAVFLIIDNCSGQPKGAYWTREEITSDRITVLMLCFPLWLPMIWSWFE
jgi:hypothetical protein